MTEHMLRLFLQNFSIFLSAVPEKTTLQCSMRFCIIGQNEEREGMVCAWRAGSPLGIVLSFPFLGEVPFFEPAGVPVFFLAFCVRN